MTTTEILGPVLAWHGSKCGFTGVCITGHNRLCESKYNSIYTDSHKTRSKTESRGLKQKSSLFLSEKTFKKVCLSKLIFTHPQKRNSSLVKIWIKKNATYVHWIGQSLYYSCDFKICKCTSEEFLFLTSVFFSLSQLDRRQKSGILHLLFSLYTPLYISSENKL